MKKQWIAIFLCLSLLATGLLGLTGCAAKVQADDLMKGITPEKTSGRAADDAFKNGAADFAVRLFQNTREEGKSSLISPLSVMLALSMTANGARGETLAQMEVLLGGGIPIDTLNKYLHAYVGGLPSVEKAKLTLANSIWFKDSGFTVEEAFLQRNADYYGAAVYKSAFDKKTLRDINNWVKENTDGVIDKIVDQMDPYPAIQYSLPSSMDNELSYDLTAPYNLIAGERYRLQTEFRYEEGTEYSTPMANWVEFEVKMNLPYKEAQPSDPITIPELQVNAMSGAMGETDEITASPCAYYWQAPEPNEDGTMSSIIGCGPAIGEETSLPEITAAAEGLISHRKASEIRLYFEVQPDTVRIQCVPQNGGEVETITGILLYDGGYAFDLKSGSFVYRVIAEWDDGNRVEYGFIGKWL